MLNRWNTPLLWVTHSDAGDVRAENQDCLFAASEWIGGRRAGLFAIADGCGGMKYGAQTSRQAIYAVQAFWEECLPQLARRLVLRDSMVMQALEDLMQSANQQVQEICIEAQERTGSTLSVLLLLDRRFWIKHVGDSRIYCLRQGMLERLTEDQSMVADMLRNHEIEDAQADEYNRSILTMCLGHPRKLYTYANMGKMTHDSIFCLCSDGLYAYSSEAAIQEQLLLAPEDTGQMRGLIADGAAHDNVSFITIWEE